MPDPGQSAGGPPAGSPAPPPQGGPQGGAPSQQPATQLQQLLAQWGAVAKQLAASNPALASGAEKISQGIHECQSALVMPPQPTPLSQQPQV